MKYFYTAFFGALGFVYPLMALFALGFVFSDGGGVQRMSEDEMSLHFLTLIIINGIPFAVLWAFAGSLLAQSRVASTKFIVGLVLGSLVGPLLAGRLEDALPQLGPQDAVATAIIWFGTAAAMAFFASRTRLSERQRVLFRTLLCGLVGFYLPGLFSFGYRYVYAPGHLYLHYLSPNAENYFWFLFGLNGVAGALLLAYAAQLKTSRERILFFILSAVGVLVALTVAKYGWGHRGSLASFKVDAWLNTAVAFVSAGALGGLSRKLSRNLRAKSA